MIVRRRPSALALLFTLRGSIVPLIASRVLAIAAVSAVVSMVHHVHPGAPYELPATPFTLLGLGLSIFLGFRNSACYDRWWEARKQWGHLLTETRCLARQVAALLPEAAVRQRVVRIAIGFAHALAAKLRGADAHEAVRAWLPEEAA